MGAAMTKRMRARHRTAVFLLIMVGSTWSPIACAEGDVQNQLAFPSYETERFCSQAAARSRQSASDCLATELAFKWTLSRVWPHLGGLEKDQAEICVNTAPFVGTLAAVVFLQEPVTVQLLAAGLLMSVGVWLHLTEHHEHEHVHAPMEHTHPHLHDEHHQHEHAPGDPPGEPHTHAHRHEPLKHKHPHLPDMHHTHRHNY